MAQADATKAVEDPRTGDDNVQSHKDKQSDKSVDKADEADPSTETMSPVQKKRKLDSTGHWDSAHCGGHIKLSENDRCMKTSNVDAEQWSCVMGSESVSTFRVRLDRLGNGGDLWIGYCKKDGFVPNGSTRGRFCQIKSATELATDVRGIDEEDDSETSHRFLQGDVLTVTHKRTAQTIVFQKNDLDIGIEYENVSDEDRFPAVVTNSDAVFITFL
ncbi:Aste57867_24361 [Aphanomyces stellatus]|uniref:Aste57867_24361 protein n=1 Tax=Aphanomyces stellatus TaxID=120398 RepID=A0A485LUK3_9STRA|nr:hypothetical protein As57867_024285 [Aphanomyces stellatus]VFU01001.1 Aste57867_24361 [Aphanomyces stellatus]